MDQIRHDSVKPCWHPIDFTDRRWAYSSYYLVLHRSQPLRIGKKKKDEKGDHQNISKTILSFTPVGCIMIVFIHSGRQERAMKVPDLPNAKVKAMEKVGLCLYKKT